MSSRTSLLSLFLLFVARFNFNFSFDAAAPLPVERATTAALLLLNLLKESDVASRR